MSTTGKKFDLDKLAVNWQDMFLDLIKSKEIDPLPPYQPTTPYRGDGKGYTDGDTRLAVSDPKRNQLKSQLEAPGSNKIGKYSPGTKIPILAETPDSQSEYTLGKK